MPKKEQESEVLTVEVDRREELQLEMEWLDVRDAFLAAKENRAKDPEAYETAKKKMSEMRTYWRQIGEATGTRNPTRAIAVSVEG